MQNLQNLEQILDGRITLPEYERSPTIEQVLNHLDNLGIEAVELGDSSDVEFVSLQDSKCLAIVGMSTCLGVIAYSPKTKSVSGVHASLFDSAHFTDVIEKHSDSFGLKVITTGCIPLSTKHTGKFLEDNNMFNPDKAEIYQVCNRYGIGQEEVIYKDAFNVEQNAQYKGMACVVVPQLERAFILASKTNSGKDRLIEVIDLKTATSSVSIASDAQNLDRLEQPKLTAVQVVEIDFREYLLNSRNRIVSEDTFLVNKLKEFGLLDKSYGYSAFDSQLIDKVVNEGQYRYDFKGKPKKYIYCAQYMKDQNGKDRIIDDDNSSVFVYCQDDKIQKRVNPEYATIAVYSLSETSTGIQNRFTFSKSSLLAVVKIKNFYP